MSHQLFEKADDGSWVVNEAQQMLCQTEEDPSLYNCSLRTPAIYLALCSLKNHFFTMLDIWGMGDKIVIEVMFRHNLIHAHDIES
jgi:hypothetical protein